MKLTTAGFPLWTDKSSEVMSNQKEILWLSQILWESASKSRLMKKHTLSIKEKLINWYNCETKCGNWSLHLLNKIKGHVVQKIQQKFTSDIILKK